MSNTPTRLGPKGVTNAQKSELFNMMGQMSPFKFTTFLEDFVKDFDIGAATPLNWTVTKVGTGTITVGSQDQGVITLTNSAADNDALSCQIKNPHFVFRSGKDSWFATRFKINDATQSDALIGMTGLDTTPIGGVGTEETGVADGVFFYKIDGQTDLRFASRKGGVTVAQKSAIATLADATNVFIGWHYDGTEFKIYVADVLVATVAAPFATGVPANVVGMNVSMQNGEAVAKSMDLCLLYSAQERF